ncbi:hypothetical protein SESBI_30424 [Sesbania bispinosa]|nr:hypothetical protein SESBI_30424 [Sesbania bispinosa]
MSLFREVRIQHIPRAENRHADALATLGSKETSQKEGPIVLFKRTERPSHGVVLWEEACSDWRKPIMEQFREKFFNKTTREYLMLKGMLYRKSPEGLLMKCVTESEGGRKLDCLHQADVCMMCKDDKLHAEVNAIEEDWRRPLKEFLETRELPPNAREAEQLKRRAKRYFIKVGELFKESFTRDSLKCLGKIEAETIMAEVHGGVCGRHRGGGSLWSEILRMGYYWPNMKEDTMDYARRANHACI